MQNHRLRHRSAAFHQNPPAPDHSTSSSTSAGTTTPTTSSSSSNATSTRYRRQHPSLTMDNNSSNRSDKSIGINGSDAHHGGRGGRGGGSSSQSGQQQRQKQDYGDDYGDDVSTSSSVSSYMTNASHASHTSHGSNSRRSHKQQKNKTSTLEMEHIDEEHGVKYDHREMTSLLRENHHGNHGNGGVGTMNGPLRPQSHAISKKQRYTNNKSSSSNSSVSISAGDGNNNNDDNNNNADADDTKNNSESDVRSRILFLKTAFWITCWYSTSLATLFLNKIILSREGSSVHVLGMCQMTTAAVLGGWSTFGGVAYVQNSAVALFRSLPESMQCRMGFVGVGGIGNAKGGGGGGMEHEKQRLSSSDPSSGTSNNQESGSSSVGGAPSKTDPNSSSSSSGVSFHFVRDMSIVGVLRGLTVVLGLIALEHVPVSFVETIKATAPAFTVLFARLILQERTATPVVLTLLPVVAGLVLCSASELRFDAVGFVAAVMNNCADCVQNVMSKRMLAHMKPTQLQFYTSVAALLLQTPFVLRDATGFGNLPSREFGGCDV